MTFRQLCLISDDTDLLGQLEGALRSQLEVVPALATPSAVTQSTFSAASELVARSAQRSTFFVVDIRKLGPGALLPNNINEGGGAFFLLASLLPDALVLALGSKRIAAGIRKELASYDPAAFELLERLIVTSVEALPAVVRLLSLEPPPLFDPSGRRFMLRDVVGFGLTARRRSDEIKGQIKNQAFVLEDDRCTALALAVALYLRGRIASIITSMRDLDNASATIAARPPGNQEDAPRLVIVDYELAFSDLTSAMPSEKADYLTAQEALSRLFPDEQARPETTVVITGAAGKQLDAAHAFAAANGYRFRTKPLSSGDGEIAAIFGEAPAPPATLGKVFRPHHHAAPKSLSLVAETMMTRARKLAQSDRFEDLGVACVLASDALDLLKDERSSLVIEALQLQERASLQLELTAAGSDADLDPAPRIGRIDSRLGLNGNSPGFGMTETGALQVRLRLLMALRRILTANDQLRGTERAIREVGTTQRRVLASRARDSTTKARYRLLAGLRWLGTTYIDKATDNGLSITRLLGFVTLWWLMLSLVFGVLFVVAGSPPDVSAAAGFKHAASALFAYPGQSGAEYFQGQLQYREVSENLATTCLLILPGECRVNVGTLYALITGIGRLVSLLHLSLIASILFRKIMHKAG